MSIGVIDFRARFPEFSDNTEFPDARIQIFIDDAVNIYMGTNELQWNGKYEYAQSYLTAHLLTSGTSSEAGDSNVKAGPIVSKSAGGVSVSRSISSKSRSDSDDFYMSTSYGQRYIMTRNTCFVGVLTVHG